MYPLNLRLFAAACLLSAPAWAQSPVRDAWASASPPATATAWDDEPPGDERTELRRTIVKSFTVDDKAALSIDNRFGDVSVALWNRNEIRVEIDITASSQDAALARKRLEAIQIDERREGNTYLFKTIIGNDAKADREGDDKEAVTNTTNSGDRALPNGLTMSWRTSTKQTGTIRISYRVSMPKANTLTIKNSFGNVNIPDFQAPLSIHSRFGDVTGAILTNLNTQINASFGNVTIRELQHGHVTMSFGDLDIDRSNVLRIEQKWGKLNIGETNKVDARTSYGEALIGAIRQSGKFRMNYAKTFRVTKIDPATEHIDVESNYSSVALPMQSMPNCDFDVTVTNSAFNVPSLPNLRMLVQPGQPAAGVTLSGGVAVPAPPHPPRTRQYVGQVGRGEGPRIKVVATYGDVRFNK